MKTTNFHGEVRATLDDSIVVELLAGIDKCEAAYLGQFRRVDPGQRLSIVALCDALADEGNWDETGLDAGVFAAIGGFILAERDGSARDRLQAMSDVILARLATAARGVAREAGPSGAIEAVARMLRSLRGAILEAIGRAVDVDAVGLFAPDRPRAALAAWTVPEGPVRYRPRRRRSPDEPYLTARIFRAS